MIISRKKYEKLNDDLIDAKAKVDNAKKSLDDENKIMRATLLVKEQRDQYKAERDTLIDDLSWYKAKVSRLERENEKLKEIKQEKEQLEESFQYQIEKRLEYFNKYQEHKALNNEISQHIGNKPSSSTYKYFRAKLDGVGIKVSE